MSGHERLVEIAHYVDSSCLVELVFNPNSRVVEQIKRRRMELAIELQRLADVDYRRLTARQHVDLLTRDLAYQRIVIYKLVGRDLYRTLASSSGVCLRHAVARDSPLHSTFLYDY